MKENPKAKAEQKDQLSANPMRAFARPIDLQTTAVASHTAPHRAEPQRVPVDLPPIVMHPIVRGESVDPGGHPTTHHLLAGGGVAHLEPGGAPPIAGGVQTVKTHIRAGNEHHSAPIAGGPVIIPTPVVKVGKFKLGKKQPPTHQTKKTRTPIDGNPIIRHNPGAGNPGGGPTSAANPIPDPGASQGQLGPQMGFVDATTTGSSGSSSGIFILLGLGVVGVVVYLYFKHKKKPASEAK